MFSRKIFQHLNSWFSARNRKPLILRGARQVGKTSAVKLWAENKFKQVLYINLEDVREKRLFQSIVRDEVGISLDDCLRVLENNFLKPGIGLNETLIFFDEIQNIPSLIQLLRFFYEQRPDLVVIAAGSYLEAQLRKIARDKSLDFTYPVGRVDYLYLYPLDFFEYLNAIGQHRLLKSLEEVDWRHLPTPDIHLQATEHFEKYFFYGGMPEVVLAQVEKFDHQRIKTIFSSLIHGYLDDLYKYEIRNSQVKYLHHIFEHAPHFAGQMIQYAGFAGSNYGSREMGEGFALLESVMLLALARGCSNEALPWIGQEKKQKKLILLDIGLVNYVSGLTFEQVQRCNLNQLHRGRIAEQVVGQQLLCDQPHKSGKLTYWAKDYREGAAEIDFCLDIHGRPCGIEVKSGANGSLKSLFEFNRKVNSAVLLKIHSDTMKESIHRDARLRSLPFYLLPRMRDLGAFT